MKSPQEIAGAMFAGDAFSQWLGIQILEVDMGYCKTSMRVRPEMVNGLGLAHGAVAFALADTTFALAANSNRPNSPSIQAMIHYLQPVKPGDLLIAESRQIKAGSRLQLYEIEVKVEEKLVCVYQGTCLQAREG